MKLIQHLNTAHIFKNLPSPDFPYYNESNRRAVSIWNNITSMHLVFEVRLQVTKNLKDETNTH